MNLLKTHVGRVYLLAGLTRAVPDSSGTVSHGVGLVLQKAVDVANTIQISSYEFPYLIYADTDVAWKTLERWNAVSAPLRRAASADHQTPILVCSGSCVLRHEHNPRR